MSKKIAGICYIKVDGEQLEISGSVEAQALEWKRESVMSLSGLAGYKETAVEQYLKVTALVPKGLPLHKLRENTTMTVTSEFSNGTVYTLSKAFLTGDSAYKADDGTIELHFVGEKGIWR